MPSNEFIAYKKGRCAHLKEIGWEAYYGTTYSGSLPQYKPDQNPCNIDIDNITMPGITLSDFHCYHKKCPYSTQAAEDGITTYVRDVNPSSPTYMQLISVDPGELTDHTSTSGIMIRYHNGPKYGNLCVDDNCYYYTSVIPGIRYFCL